MVKLAMFDSSAELAEHLKQVEVQTVLLSATG
jgi:hypothetical protein